MAGLAKVDEDTVRKFLSEAWDGESLVKKADRYPLTRWQLGKIRSGKCWKNVYREFMSSKNAHSNS